MKRNYLEPGELAALPPRERQAYLEKKKAAVWAAIRAEKDLRAWAQRVWEETRFYRGDPAPANLRKTAIRLFIFGFCRGDGCLEPSALSFQQLQLLRQELELLEEARRFLPAQNPPPPGRGGPRWVFT